MPPRKRNVLLGMARLAHFRIDGFAEFGDMPQDFLNSLAPLCGFTVVATLLRVAAGHATQALTEMLITLIALLAPPVIAHVFARLWGREAAWLRYVTAFTWCQWVIVISFALLLMGVSSVLTGLGASPDVAIAVAEFAWAVYGLAVHWFLARHGLGIGRARSVLVVAAVELGTFALLLGPLIASGRPLVGAGGA